MEDCEIVVGDRSLNSGGNAHGNLQESVARVVRLGKGKSSFGAETMGYRSEFKAKKIVAGGNVFLCGTAFETVGTYWRVSARITFENPIYNGAPD
jgi:hypothetical protein